jgi:DNA repair exonuclease SbcCD ATPase subunit
MATKKILIISSILMLIAATLGTAMAQPPVDVPGRKVLIHRFNVAFYQMETLRIGMDEVIEYAQEINASTEKLEELRDEFVSKATELNESAEKGDLKEFNSVLADIREIVKEFRLESHKVLGDKVGEAQVRVAQALQENRDYLLSLVENIAKSRKEADLEVVDKALGDAEKKVDKLKEKGANVTPLKIELKKIKEKREALREKLDAAIESCKGVGLEQCNTTEAKEYKALKEEIKREFKELREASKKTWNVVALSNIVRASENIVEKAKERLEKLEERGIDVTVPLAKLDQIQEMLDSVEGKLQTGEYDEAIEELKAARDAFRSIGREISEAIKEARRGPPEEVGKPEKIKVEEKEDGTKIKVEGDIDLSGEARITLEKLVSSLKGASVTTSLKLKIEKENGEITNVEAKLEGNALTAEQRELWNILQEEVKSLVQNASKEDIELDIEIEHEIETPEIEIKAKIKGNQTEVEIEKEGMTTKFVLNTTNRGEIISEIASRTELPESEVQTIIEISEEEIEIEHEVEIEKPEGSQFKKEETEEAGESEERGPPEGVPAQGGKP